METSLQRTTAAVLLAVVLASCGTATRESAPATVPPGAPGESSLSPASVETAQNGRPRYTEADTRFMQHMIAHHAQALAMTRLVPDRSTRRDIGLLAERIEVSQRDEIRLMQQWLRERGQEVPDPEAHLGHRMAGGDHALMPGMLTPEQLDRLAAATGAEFDRLFLQFMIQHHEGALIMVDEIFATPGAGQETATFQVASEIGADQRMEIERMRRLLQTAASGGAQPR